MLKSIATILLYVSGMVLALILLVAFGALSVLLWERNPEANADKIWLYSTCLAAIIMGTEWGAKMIKAISSVRGEPKDFNPKGGGSIPPRGTKPL